MQEAYLWQSERERLGKIFHLHIKEKDPQNKERSLHGKGKILQCEKDSQEKSCEINLHEKDLQQKKQYTNEKEANKKGINKKGINKKDLQEKEIVQKDFEPEEIMPEAMFYSFLENESYRQNVYVSRNVPKFLEHLAEHPAVNCLSMPFDQAKEKAEALIRHYETVIPALERKEEYTRKYGTYLAAGRQRADCKSCSVKLPDDFREVYMDNNATTALSPEAADILVDYAQGVYGYANPGSVSAQGDYAADLVQKAREEVAAAIHASADEIYFTASGTEANNLAVKGTALRYLEASQRGCMKGHGNGQIKGHIITTMMEHASVLQTVRYLEKIGFEATYLKPDAEGMIQADAVAAAIRPDTILAAVMAANNEIGTVYPVREIAAVCEEAGIPFFTDGVQAYCKIPIDAADMRFTMFSCSGHKINGPKGIGALYIRKGTTLAPLVHGGGQERGMRSGTENTGHILAMGAAAKASFAHMEEESARLSCLRIKLRNGIQKIVPDAVFFGPEDQRLHGLLSAGFPGIDANRLLNSLNQMGICVSAGSACSARKKEASHVLQAIGADTRHLAVIRFGMGRFTTEEDVRYVLENIDSALAASNPR